MFDRRKVTGIILSGGKSSRMGTEKGMVQWNGKPLIEYSLDAIRTVCDQMVISSANDCYSYLGLPVVKDEIENCGPLGGIYSCMKAFPSDIYLVISCDVPLISSYLFLDLLKNLEGADVSIPLEENGNKQPLVAVYSNRCFGSIRGELLEGRFKMMNLLNLLNVNYFEISSSLPYYNYKLFFNTNSMEDFSSI